MEAKKPIYPAKTELEKQNLENKKYVVRKRGR